VEFVSSLRCRKLILILLLMFIFADVRILNGAVRRTFGCIVLGVLDAFPRLDCQLMSLDVGQR
jgi:hypothetical protein